MDKRGKGRSRDAEMQGRRTTVIWLLTAVACVAGAFYLAKREDEDPILERVLHPIFGDGWFASIVMQLSFLLVVAGVFGLLYGIDKLLFRRKSEGD